MQSQDIQMGLDTHQAQGPLKGRNWKQWPLLSPPPPPGVSSREEAMPGFRVGGASHGTEKEGGGGEGAQDGLEQPTHHHLLPLAFRGKVHVVGVGGRQWGSDLV